MMTRRKKRDDKPMPMLKSSHAHKKHVNNLKYFSNKKN